MRRAALTATAVLLLLLAVVGTAGAAGTALNAPEGDVTGPTRLAVGIGRESALEPIERVEVRLHRGETAMGQRVALTCTRNCASHQTERVYELPDGQRFDPRTGAPFGVEGPLANGTYRLQGRIDRGGLPAQTFRHELHLAVPPRAPSGLTAEAQGAEVRLTWERGPEPDLARYRVEREDADGWHALGTTVEASHRDDPGPGRHRYRVSAVRPDGRGGLLEATSDGVAVEVEEPSDDADDPDDGADDDGPGGEGNGDAEGDGDPEGDGDAEGDGGVSGPTVGDAPALGGADGADGDGADGAGEGAAGDGGDEASSGRSGGGSAEAPSLDSRGSGRIPSLDGGGQGGGADGDDFADELDYGSVAGDDAGADDADDVTVAAPGGWRGSMDRLFDPQRAAVPIAVGLLMTASGLHLWRWLRVPAA